MLCRESSGKAWSRWLHPDRAAGRHCDHRRIDRAVAARRAVGPRSGPPCPVHQQPQANGPGGHELRELQRHVSHGRSHGARLADLRPHPPGLRALRGAHAVLRAGRHFQRLELQHHDLQDPNSTVSGVGISIALVPQRWRHRRPPVSRACRAMAGIAAPIPMTFSSYAGNSGPLIYACNDPC